MADPFAFQGSEGFLGRRFARRGAIVLKRPQANLSSVSEARAPEVQSYTCTFFLDIFLARIPHFDTLIVEICLDSLKLASVRP